MERNLNINFTELLMKKKCLNQIKILVAAHKCCRAGARSRKKFPVLDNINLNIFYLYRKNPFKLKIIKVFFVTHFYGRIRPIWKNADPFPGTKYMRIRNQTFINIRTALLWQTVYLLNLHQGQLNWIKSCPHHWPQNYCMSKKSWLCFSHIFAIIKYLLDILEK